MREHLLDMRGSVDRLEELLLKLSRLERGTKINHS